MAGRDWLDRVRFAAKRRVEDVAVGLAERAVDALETVDRVRREGSRQALRLADKVPLQKLADRVPLGKLARKLPLRRGGAANTRGEGAEALQVAREQARRVIDAAKPDRAAAPKPAAKKRDGTPRKVARAEPRLPLPTDPAFRLEDGAARVTTTSRGRKTVPIAVAAARQARKRAQGEPGFKPKKGQKKRHH